jgi:hypothetical protein
MKRACTIEFVQYWSNLVTGEQSYRTFRQGVRLEEVASTLGISVIDKSQEVARPRQVD